MVSARFIPGVRFGAGVADVLATGAAVGRDGGKEKAQGEDEWGFELHRLMVLLQWRWRFLIR